MKIKQFFLDYPTFQKAQTRYWIILLVFSVFLPWVSFVICWTLVCLIVVLGVGQNEDFFFEREVNMLWSLLYYVLASLGLFVLLAEPIGNPKSWLTCLAIALPHLFFRQQFQFIAEQHNQFVQVKGKPTPAPPLPSEPIPFREDSLPNQIGRVLGATALILIGLGVMFYCVKQWFTGTTLNQDESTTGLIIGFSIALMGREMLK